MYRLDKSYTKAQTFKEADNNLKYWKTKSVAERLSAAWYLTCLAYGLDPEKEHRLDPTVHSCREHPVK